MADLLTGQVETLLPALLEATAAKKAAEAAEADLKAKLAAIIGEPKTVKTVWGTVTLVKGRKTKQIVSKVLKAKIDLMMAEGLESGDVVENIGQPFIQVKTS